jgi:excisionase family DNA binding protein
MDRNQTKLLKVKQVARLLNISSRTVQLMCDSGKLQAVRLPTSRGDRRISIDSVERLLRESGVELDLRELDKMEVADSLPSVVLISVPDGIVEAVSHGNFAVQCHLFPCPNVLMGSALIGIHRPCVVVLDATGINGWHTVVWIREMITQLVPGAVLVVRCYDDPGLSNVRGPFSEELAANPETFKTCNESAYELGRMIFESLYQPKQQKLKVSA